MRRYCIFVRGGGNFLYFQKFQKYKISRNLCLNDPKDFIFTPQHNIKERTVTSFYDICHFPILSHIMMSSNAAIGKIMLPIPIFFYQKTFLSCCIIVPGSRAWVLVVQIFDRG